MVNQPREPQPYEDCQAKLIEASRAITHRRIKEFGYSCRQRRLTWAKEKTNWTVAQWSKFLFSDESKFCILFGNQGPRVWRKGGEAHSPSCLKSSVKFLQSVMIWGAMSSAGVGPLCFFWKPRHCTRLPKHLWSTSCFLLLTSFLKKDADFIFQHDLAPAHTAKSTESWLNDHGVCVFDWPANSPDLNPKENIWGIVKRKMRNKRPNKCRWTEGNCQRNLGFHTTSAVPQPDHLHATLNWDSN